jgi:PAS domain S-box-containing protein
VIWTVDLEMRLTYVSPSVKNLLGLTPEEAMSRSMTDAYTKESFEKAMQVFFEEMAIEGSVQADANRTRVVGLELIHKDGRIIPAEGNFCFLRDLEGHAVGILSIVRDIRERKQAEETREKLILELRDALSKIKKLSGMLPICATCKKIRDDKGYWNQIESYIKDNSEAEFSHGICPECAQRLYQTFLDKQ